MHSKHTTPADPSGKLLFIVPCAVDTVGAIIDRPCSERLRIRRNPMRNRNVFRRGRSLSAPTYRIETER